MKRKRRSFMYFSTERGVTRRILATSGFVRRMSLSFVWHVVVGMHGASPSFASGATMSPQVVLAKGILLFAGAALLEEGGCIWPDFTQIGDEFGQFLVAGQAGRGAI